MVADTVLVDRLLSKIKNVGTSKLPLRCLAFQKLKNLIPYYNDFGRPHYRFCIVSGAILARQLGYKKMSILELGVAGGNGLICIEKICQQVKKRWDMDFEIFGFDMESGLPKPKDCRDVPYEWDEGYYKMDRSKLENRLQCSKLIVGDVKETTKNFFKMNPAPIGAIMFDLDYYSSTKDAFQLLQNPNDDFYLPRIQCYFDDLNVIESVGVRLAIKEFNQENKFRKIESNYERMQQIEISGHRIFEFHNFLHKDYNKNLKKSVQLPLLD